jgi:hypothetical protein
MPFQLNTGTRRWQPGSSRTAGPPPRDAAARRARHGGVVGIIVLIEPQAGHRPDLDGKSWVVGGLRAVHAAAADPGTPDVPADRTLCGQDTRAMEKHSYHPASPGSAWYPPNLTPWLCRACDAAVHG